MKKILVINGPNLNLLGLREPALYGAQNFETLQASIREWAAGLALEVELFQSNHECGEQFRYFGTYAEII